MCRSGQSYSKKNKRGSRGTKKALIEAQSIIAAAKDGLPPVTPSVGPPDTPAADPPPGTPSANLTTTQWLSVISIIVSLAGVYYKREEIKSVFTKKVLLNFNHHEPRLLMPLQNEKWESWIWIKRFICF